MSLCLQNLKNYKDEILKAEIGALLFNLGKTHIGISNWKDYFDDVEQKFSSYKDYYKQDYFEDELKNVSQDLRNFIFNKFVNIDSNTLKWVEFFKGDASNESFIQKVFFRGCENINSGIDKGSPKEQIQGKLWISNAFGSFIKEVKEKDFDNRRKCFFITFDEKAKEQSWYINPNFAQIREFVLYELKKWYSNLLSDNRIPINDVTLFDQAYMSASMFKATLGGMLLKTEQSKNYKNNPQSIKWQILGIQYDKLALAEKGLKPAHINWYRENAKKVDKKVKEIIELDYALGNEIYKDESGIYFIAPEGIGNESLSDDLQEVKDKILYTFNDVFNDEVYPYIGLTKPSRGTMNLTFLLDKAKENFLKADYSKKSQISIVNLDRYIGICQVCKNKLVKKADSNENENRNDEALMCEICKNRKKGRIDKWLGNQNGKTIWIGELANKNNQIAFVNLKFELIEWLNGDLLSSLLVRNEDYHYWFNQIQVFIKLFYSDIVILNINTSSISENFKNCLSNEEKRTLGRKIGELKNIEKERENIINFLKEIRDNNLTLFNQPIKTKEFENILIELIDKFIEKVENLINIIEGVLSDSDIINKIDEEEIRKLHNLKNELFQYNIDNFLIQLTEDAYIGCKKWDENFNNYIQQIFFSSIIGNDLEDEVNENILNDKINWNTETINWNNLNESEIALFSKYLLQFILRKNPSPARLRRVWESTSNFFKEVKQEILDTFTAERKKDEFLDFIEDFPEDKKSKVKDNIIFKQYFSIIDPTPISWQFVIPTEKIEKFVDKVQKLYYENFKYVNGKLPLHVGIVVQNYKKPLYVGIKALRNIRRDIKNWQEIKKEGINLLEDLRCYEKVIEQNNNTKDYYSLYETDNFDYDFILLSSSKGVKFYNDRDKFVIYPNTFDFEFLDTNTRRNDIYYQNAKRLNPLKNNRPYNWQEWQNFKNFRDFFDGKTALLHRVVSLIYSKMQDWENYENSFKKFMQSVFKKEEIDIERFGIKDYSFNEMKKFIDMFEFWHTTLKEI